MKIYADPITVNCRKVLAGLKLIGADYELVHVDYFKGQQKEAPYLAINPNASIPAMVEGDFVLWESNAILQYAADKHGNATAYPTDLITRADINRWLLWESSSWFPSCYVYLVENCVKPFWVPNRTPRCSMPKLRISINSPVSSINAWRNTNGLVAPSTQPLPTLRWLPPCICTVGSSCHWHRTHISRGG